MLGQLKTPLEKQQCGRLFRFFWVVERFLQKQPPDFGARFLGLPSEIRIPTFWKEKTFQLSSPSGQKGGQNLLDGNVFFLSRLFLLA